VLNRFIAVAAITVMAAGCGRREERAWFDAKQVEAPIGSNAKALPVTALRVRWTPPAAPLEIRADGFVSFPVTFTNIGDTVWPDKATAHPQKRDGSFAVRVAHWWARGGLPRQGAVRTDLPHSIAPGESITVVLELHAPAQPGDQQLVVELVQELVQWFRDAGAQSLTIPCRIVAPDAAAPRSSP
jgi:hypothetical protein